MTNSDIREGAAGGASVETRRGCPSCGSECAVERGTKNNFRMLACRDCLTLYVRSLPARGEAKDYDSYYGPENLTVPTFIERWLDEIVATFAPYKQQGRLLDVGCGAGSILQAAQRAGWTPHGMEVSRTAADHNTSQGFDVFCGELAEAQYPDGHFDVVIASEVLEHVASPSAMLAEIARVLRPGGLLWATTPHGRGVSARVLGLGWSAVSPPEHLHLFSLTGIKRLLEDAGFRRVQVVTHGVNPYEIVHGLRSRRSPTAAAGAAQEQEAAGHGFNRVETSYQLNEFLSESPSRRALKALANGMLGVARLGDSLKIRAEK